MPEYVFEELRRHLPELRKRTGLRAPEARAVLDRLTPRFTVVSPEAVARALPDAERIMADIDAKDATYLAAALAVPCDGIWSDDSHLQRQKAVRCWTTPQVVAELRASGLRI